MSIFRTVGFCAGLFLSCPASAVDDAGIIRFAGEDWPPFVSETLPGNGLSGTIMSTVFHRLGYVSKIEFFPWKRTVQLGLNSPRYAGFLAVWRTPEREKLCHFSASIGSTQTVLVYLKEAPLRAGSLAELKGVRIGTVAGYSNGEQFDAMVKRGELTTEEGVNDEVNLKKLLIRRFRVIVIEKHVLRHMLMGPGFSKADRERIAVADHFFKERPVHICFKRTEEGYVQQKTYNEAAKAVDIVKLEKDYWKRIGEDAVSTTLNF